LSVYNLGRVAFKNREIVYLQFFIVIVSFLLKTLFKIGEQFFYRDSCAFRLKILFTVKLYTYKAVISNSC